MDDANGQWEIGNRDSDRSCLQSPLLRKRTAIQAPRSAVMAVGHQSRVPDLSQLKSNKGSVLLLSSRLEALQGADLQCHAKLCLK